MLSSPPPRDSTFSQTPLILKSYLLYRPIAKQVQNLPKSWRYSLGKEIQKKILLVIDHTTQALYARQPLREPYILKIIGTLHTIQLFLRLALDEKLVTEQQFFTWSDQVIELQRMAAGWLASVRSPGLPNVSSPRGGSRP